MDKEKENKVISINNLSRYVFIDFEHLGTYLKKREQLPVEERNIEELNLQTTSGTFTIVRDFNSRSSLTIELLLSKFEKECESSKIRINNKIILELVQGAVDYTSLDKPSVVSRYRVLFSKGQKLTMVFRSQINFKKVFFNPFTEISQEQLQEALKTYHDQVKEYFKLVEDSAVRAFGKGNVDISLADEPNGYTQLKLRIPELTITNESRKHRKIKDLYLLILFKERYINEGEIYGLTTNFTVDEYQAGYMHSHLSFHDTSNAQWVWRRFCLGNSDLAMRLANGGNKLLNSEELDLLMYEIASFMECESLAGVPHMYINHIGTSHQTNPWNSNSVNIPRAILRALTTLFKDYLASRGIHIDDVIKFDINGHLINLSIDTDIVKNFLGLIDFVKLSKIVDKPFSRSLEFFIAKTYEGKEHYYSHNVFSSRRFQQIMAPSGYNEEQGILTTGIGKKIPINNLFLGKLLKINITNEEETNIQEVSKSGFDKAGLEKDFLKFLTDRILKKFNERKNSEISNKNIIYKRKIIHSTGVFQEDLIFM